ncbi:MAG: hypothetical protein HDR94_04745 [Bacteroides sp.]|nr:hypothetical protein [Bacteroides sp.]
MSYILKYSKFLVVLQLDEIKSLDSRWVSTIAPMIVEARDGNILDTDDIISNSSELYIKRCAYDAHGCMYIQETKMTSDCAILGPISDHDENSWYNRYTNAVISAGFRNYFYFICDFSRLSNHKNEMKVYLQNISYNLYASLNSLRCSIIPVINEKMDHYITEFMRQTIFIEENVLEIKDLFKIFSVAKSGEDLLITMDKDFCNKDSELKISNYEDM